MNSTPSAKAIANRLDHRYFVHRNTFRIVRRVLIILACAGVMLAWGAYVKRGDQTIYSPGKLTSVHSMWDGNNCASCHEPQAGGGFSQVVSDNACTRCHDGAIHHPNQATLVSFAADKPPVRSADCTACHAEHRGHEQLVSRNDSTCTQCHADLLSTTRDGKAHIQPKVTAFATGDHPPFGRSLTPDKVWSAGTPKLIDPTPIRFNHEAHQVHIKPTAGATQNCTFCHQTTANRLGGPDRATMAPISYDLHCAQCHPLDLIKAGGIVVPHESLDVVRPYLAGSIGDLPRRFRQELDAMPEAFRNKELVTIKMVARPPLAPIKKEVRITPEQWVATRVAGVLGELKKWYEDVGPSIPGFDAIKSAIESPGQPAPAEGPSRPDPWTDPRMIEFFVAHTQPGIKSQNKCNLCHDLSDNISAVNRLRLSAGAPMNTLIVERFRSSLTPTTAPTSAPADATTRPATPAMPLATLPTGYTTGPRHWFVQSRFDHRAHRLISCTDCHAQAKVSQSTSDVLLPSMDSCTTCHVPQATPQNKAGATISCIACHDFHDRTRERATAAGVP